MKKRLSNNVWLIPILVLASVGLMIYLSTVLRAISMASRYGIVEAQIPVLQIPIRDEGFQQFQEKAAANVNRNTVLVLLTTESLYFGTVASFAQDLTNIRNKFQIPHDQGAPQLAKLRQDLSRWMSDKSLSGEDLSSSVLIFLPTEDIPMPIVIQCLAYLQSSGLFKTIVMGGGLV